MRIFRNVWFRKFARKLRIGDRALCEAVARAESGLVDVDLGVGLIKQRVAREGSVKSGGYRTLVVFRTATRSVFVFGFANSDQDNIDRADQREAKRLADLLLGLSDDDLDRLAAAGTLGEVKCNEAQSRKDVSQ